MRDSYQLLHLEDDPLDAELARIYLADSPIRCSVRSVGSQADYLQALTDGPFDLVISDFNLGSFDGIRAFHLLQERHLGIPFILLSGAIGEIRAVECLKIGMTDYVLKDHIERLVPVVERALRESRERHERIAAQAALEKHQQKHQQEIEDLNRRLQWAIKESQHRIKNNLQVLTGLVDAMRMDSVPSSQRQALTRLTAHIRGLATLHDLLLYQTGTSDASLDSVSARTALERLVPAMAVVLAPHALLTLEVEDIALTLKQVTSLSMILNELISNAIKHGEGTIAISLKRNEDSSLVLEVSNEGTGFPVGFDSTRSAGIGLSIIESVGTWDLSGALTYENTAAGARVRLRFPISGGFEPHHDPQVSPRHRALGSLTVGMTATR